MPILATHFSPPSFPLWLSQALDLMLYLAVPTQACLSLLHAGSIYASAHTTLLRFLCVTSGNLKSLFHNLCQVVITWYIHLKCVCKPCRWLHPRWWCFILRYPTSEQNRIKLLSIIKFPIPCIPSNPTRPPVFPYMPLCIPSCMPMLPYIALSDHRSIHIPLHLPLLPKTFPAIASNTKPPTKCPRCVVARKLWNSWLFVV